MRVRSKINTPRELLTRLDHNNISYPELLGIARHLKQIFTMWGQISDRMALTQTRIALVGSHTLSFLQAPLAVNLAGRGITADWFTGEFDNYRWELLDENSGIHKFKPQIVIILLDHRAIRIWPDRGASVKTVLEMATKQMQEWVAFWENAHKAWNATVIQTNIALPCERFFGNFESKTPWSPSSYLHLLNRLVVNHIPSFVGICDADYLSGFLGKQVWFDEPLWYNAGQGFGFQALCLLARNMAGTIAGVLGKAKKCLVLDLDNTLWGGVIGDAGVECITLGRGNPVGEAFVEFQTYCKRLKERGILLAVCSKNNEDIARKPFEVHPEMALKVDDFSAFYANWEDKASNIVKIASDLNLGLDSFVFIDDNPAERELVRQFLPEVAVPEMPEDPAFFRRVIDQYNYFDIWSITSEDIARNEYYAAENKRKRASVNITGLTEYLKSLQQICTMGSFDEINLQRTIQLTNKTNQWNLTTLRMTEGDIRQRMIDPSYFTLWVRHRDKFGDSGLIALLIARQSDDVMEIENWLMSCRVINRGIEDCIFGELLNEIRRRGMRTIRGFYRPTAKNGMVAKLYSELGFKYRSEDKDGTTIWELESSENISPRPYYIEKEIAIIKKNCIQGN